MFDPNTFGQMMLQQMNPMNKVMQSFADGQLKSQQDELAIAKASAIEKVATNLEKAKASSQSQSVIDAYERILVQLSS